MPVAIVYTENFLCSFLLLIIEAVMMKAGIEHMIIASSVRFLPGKYTLPLILKSLFNTIILFFISTNLKIL